MGEEEEEEDDDGEEEEEEESEGEEEEESAEEETKSEVKEGTKEKLDTEHLKKMQEDEEYRLRVMMVPRKHRGLYKSMMKNRKKRTNEARCLEKNRKQWDEQNATSEP